MVNCSWQPLLRCWCELHRAPMSPFSIPAPCDTHSSPSCMLRPCPTLLKDLPPPSVVAPALAVAPRPATAPGSSVSLRHVTSMSRLRRRCTTYRKPTRTGIPTCACCHTLVLSPTTPHLRPCLSPCPFPSPHPWPRPLPEPLLMLHTSRPQPLADPFAEAVSPSGRW